MSIIDIHEGIKYPCNQCDYQATQQGSLKTHIQSKHEGVKYPCNQCDYQFTDKSSLRKHIQSKHEYIKYPCNQCDYLAPRQDSLKTHISRRHRNKISAFIRVKEEDHETETEVERRKAEDKNIKDQSLRKKKTKLRNQISKDNKSTQCPECRAEFTNRGVMVTHYRSRHEGVRYPCIQCDYLATRQKRLLRRIFPRRRLKKI